MIGAVKEVDVDGAKYTIQKQGVSACLEIQAVFFDLTKNAGKDYVPDKSLSKEDAIADENAAYYTGVVSAFRGKVIEDVKRVIMSNVKIPKLGDADYESLPAETIPLLFLDIYNFNFEATEKKSEPTMQSAAKGSKEKSA